MTNRKQAANAEDAQGATPPVASARYSWVVVLLLWTVCFFSYADRQAFFSVFPLLQKEMALTSVQLGLLGSSFAVIYGLGDRWPDLWSTGFAAKLRFLVDSSYGV